MNLPVGNAAEYVGALSGMRVPVNNGYISVNVKANSGEIWLPADEVDVSLRPVDIEVSRMEPKIEKAAEPAPIEKKIECAEKCKEKKSYEEMTVEELQEAILEKMRKNGPVTDQMRKDVMDNVYHNSLVTWIKSFH